MAGGGHLRKSDDNEHHNYDKAKSHIGVTNDGKVVETNRSLLGSAERGEDYLTCGIADVAEKVGQHDKRGHSHTAERAHGVESLGEIETTGSSLLTAERQNERVGGCLNEGQTEREHIERQTEERELLIGRSGDKHKRADSVEAETEQTGLFIAVATDEERSRDSHGSIASVECKLHHRGLCRREVHHRLKRRHHRIGDIVGESPEGEKRGDEHERDHIAALDQSRATTGCVIKFFHDSRFLML